LSRVYLVRHGQAGLRHNYDQLSELGVTQARLLREWFVREGIELDSIVSGSLTRQVETARHAAGEPEIEPLLAEFDLDMVYRSIAPVLRELDPEFRREYEAMVVSMRSDHAPVHRQWNGCDVKVFRAWQSGELPVDGESWVEFKARILSALGRIRQIGSRRHAAIFTSATPIGLLLAEILQAPEDRAMRLAGACYNSSVTTLRVHDGDISLISFNSVAHLRDPAQRTFR
jgi:broad specificity phosphatase PhoE